MRIGMLFWIGFFVWAASEVFITVRAKILRSSLFTSKKRSDRGSYWLILIGIYAGIGIAFFFRSQGWGWVCQPIANISAVLMLAGVALRVYSVLALGRNFSTIVSVDPDQKLVRNGPYKLIRHPAYSGLLLTLCQLGLALNSWIAACINLIMFSSVIVYRIRVEENVLESQFHSDYENYCQNTWRLIPYIW